MQENRGNYHRFYIVPERRLVGKSIRYSENFPVPEERLVTNRVLQLAICYVT